MTEFPVVDRWSADAGVGVFSGNGRVWSGMGSEWMVDVAWGHFGCAARKIVV